MKNAERGTGNAERSETRNSEPAVVRIERLASGGDGVGKMADGRTVFVPRTAPGDLVELGRVREHSRFARARIGQLIESGPGRITPRCPHYLADDCGGCQLQHLDQAAQLKAKHAFVAETLSRIGGLTVEVLPVIAATEAWNYRSRISLAVGPGRRQAGFHPVDQASRVFALEYCHIAALPLMELWQQLRLHLYLLPPDVDQLVLRLDPLGRRHVVVKSRGDQAWTGGKQLGERLKGAANVWWQPEVGAPRVVYGDRDSFPATVFEQVNAGLSARIRDEALQSLGDVAGRHVWDLYAGVGETTEALLQRGATVESIELNRRAVELGEQRWRLANQIPENSQRPESIATTRHAGKAEDLVAGLRTPAAVITNPPRAGMDRRVTREIIARGPRRVVYISCDPATLARDLSLLCGTAREADGPRGAYRVVRVQPFDLFPQTAHVETVVVLEAE